MGKPNRPSSSYRRNWVGFWLIDSFVADTLKLVQKDMRGKQVREEDVEDHVSACLNAHSIGDS